MSALRLGKAVGIVALLAEGVDRNGMWQYTRAARVPSPSSRRAWIEMLKTHRYYGGESMVALLAEGVDRNRYGHHHRNLQPVALLAEGVDRNKNVLSNGIKAEVALLAEGVDRNRAYQIHF